MGCDALDLVRYRQVVGSRDGREKPLWNNKIRVISEIVEEPSDFQ